MSEKQRRQQRIVELVQSRPIGSQEQLARALKDLGMGATQATLSRDLRDLGVMKGPSGYTLPGEMPPAQPTSAELARAVRTYLIRADAAGCLAILHTGPGRAQLLALELDRARLRSIVGTVAGDDTIFAAARSPREAGRIARDLRHLAGIR